MCGVVRDLSILLVLVCLILINSTSTNCETHGIWLYQVKGGSERCWCWLKMVVVAEKRWKCGCQGGLERESGRLKKLPLVAVCPLFFAFYLGFVVKTLVGTYFGHHFLALQKIGTLLCAPL